MLSKGALWEIIEQLHAIWCCRHGEHSGAFHKARRIACRHAGFSDKLFHDLRRTVVSNMTRAGMPRPIAKRISGHKTDAVFERYDIVNETGLREAVYKTQTFLQTWTVSAARG